MKILFVLVLAGAVSGCTGSRKIPVVVYSPHGREMLSDFQKLYEAANPDQEVRWLDMGSQDAYDRIRTERDNPQADVWWGAPMTMFGKAADEHLLERYVPTWDSAVGASFKSSEGWWYGTFITPEVIMYNNRVLADSEAPGDWDELLEPRWRDKIIIRSPLASGTMRTIFCALIEREAERKGTVDAGFAWLRRLDGNTKTYVADPTQLYLRIAREEALVSVWDLPDVVVSARTYGYPFGFVIPRSGTPLITDCIAIVKGAKHAAQAREFYEFVTSRESMLRQASLYQRIPTRTDLPARELPSWIAALSLKPMAVDWRMLEEHEQAWMQEWDQHVKGTGKGQIADP